MLSIISRKRMDIYHDITIKQDKWFHFMFFLTTFSKKNKQPPKIYSLSTSKSQNSTLLCKYAQGTCLVWCIQSIFSIPHPCNPCPKRKTFKQATATWRWLVEPKGIFSANYLCYGGLHKVFQTFKIWNCLMLIDMIFQNYLNWNDQIHGYPM